MSRDQKEDSNRSLLESRIAVLEELLVRLAQAGATESILGHGFEQVSNGLKSVSAHLKDIAVQVAPLRQLGPEQPQLNFEQKAMMDKLYKALVPPEPMEEPKHSHAEHGHVGFDQRSAS